jgi:uncharacterized protein (TIGR02266 family)
MTVRYKSATLDEFIEHHSHDVSRGGMFIKTPQPFPPGTLLKFEVRIAEDRKVMQGVGRVVWKRDNVAVDPERPAGMGVKFIKLDDESRQLIDQVLASRSDESSSFDNEREAGVESEALGLTGVTKESLPPTGTTSFFPKSDKTAESAPEDRTVMKQASELLEEALREVGSAPPAAAVEKKPEAIAAEREELTNPGRPSPSVEPPMPSVEPPTRPFGNKVLSPEAEKAPESSKEERKVVSASAFVAAAKVAEAGATQSSVGAKSTTANVSSAPPSTRPASPKPLASGRASSLSGAGVAVSGKPTSAVAPAAERSASGHGRAAIWMVAVAASVGLVLWFTRSKPEPVPQQPERVTVEPQAAPAAPEPQVQPNPQPSQQAEASSAVASAAPAPSTQLAVPATNPVSAPVVAPSLARVPVAKKAKAVSADESGTATAATSEPTTTTEAVEKPAEAKPAEAKPAEAKPVEAKPAEPATPTPPPATTPTKAKSADPDNPY